MAAPDAAGDDERGPCRRCIVTGTVGPKERLLRFVVGPGQVVVPDVTGILPGRGIWLSASRDVVNTAAAKSLFAKAARARVEVPADLADRVERLLARRCGELLGLARRAGQLVVGYEKVTGALRANRGGLLLAAADGAASGREKVRRLAAALPSIEVLRSDELGAALGRDHAVHVLVDRGNLANQLLREATRLAGFRPGQAIERETAERE